VVVKAELNYVRSLTSGDQFDVSVTLARESKLRMVFTQAIKRTGTNETIMHARITATAVNERGRPYFPDELLPLLE
jgi:acyl-CoA thioester hydrolase